MRANNTIYFAVRASKSRQNGMCPILVQLTKNGLRFVLGLSSLP